MAAITKKYHHHQHASQLLSCLRELQVDTWFCDLVLVVSGREFHVHRIVMAAASPYFRSLITYDTHTPSQEQQHVSSTQARVELSLDCLTPIGFEAIVSYIYTGQLWLSEDNAQDVVKAANALLFPDLENTCWDFLRERVALDNCVSIMALADLLDCSSVKSVAMEMVKENFYKVCQGQDFLTQPPHVIAGILSLRGLKLGEDSLKWFLQNGHTQNTILQAVLSWIYHNPLTRKQYLQDLLNTVRWCNYSERRLQDFIQEAEHVKKDPSLQDILQMAYVSSQSETVSKRKKQDREQFVDVIVCAGGHDKKWKLKEEVLSFPLHSPATFEYLHLPPMNTPRQEHAMLAVGDYLYVTGGDDASSNELDSMERYDPHSNKWTTLTSMPRIKVCHQMVANEETIYVVEGDIYSGNWKDPVQVDQDIFAYDIRKNSWRILSCKFTIARRRPCFVLHKNDLYCIGGEENDRPVRFVECVNIVTETVHQKANLLRPVASCTTLTGCVMGDFIYVHGGSFFDPKDDTPSQLYDTLTDSWTKLPVPTYKNKKLYLPTEMYGLWYISNKLYMVHISDGFLVAEDIKTGKWIDIETCSTPPKLYHPEPVVPDNWGHRFTHYRLPRKTVNRLQKEYRKVPNNKTVDEYFKLK